MATDYDRLRAALEAEIAEPGALTKTEARQVLVDNPPDLADDYDDASYDPTFYA